MNRYKKLMILSLSLVLLIGAASAGTFQFGTTTPSGAVQGAFAANANGDIAITIAGAVQADTFVSETVADDTDGVSAGQETDIDSQAGFTASGAASGDGNTATTANLVHDGTIETDQSAFALTDVEAIASQDSTLKGDQVLVCSSASEVSGTEASTMTHLEDGVVAGEEVVGSFSGLSEAVAIDEIISTAMQDATVLGTDIEANTCADDGNGDTITIEAEADAGLGVVYQNADAGALTSVYGIQVVGMETSGETEVEIEATSSDGTIDAEVEMDGVLNGVVVEQNAQTDNLAASQNGWFATSGEGEAEVEMETASGFESDTEAVVTQGGTGFNQYTNDLGGAVVAGQDVVNMSGVLGSASTEVSNPWGETASTISAGLGVNNISAYQAVSADNSYADAFQDTHIDVEVIGSATTTAENEDGMLFVTTSDVVAGTIDAVQYGYADWPSEASGYQYTAIAGLAGTAITAVADEDGNAASTTSSVVVGTIDAYQDAEIGRPHPGPYEAEASQDTTIMGEAGAAATTATNDDGDTAWTESTVVVGVIDAFQVAEAEDGRHHEAEAFQHTEIYGLPTEDPLDTEIAGAGAAVTGVIDEHGNTAVTNSAFVLGTLDARQWAEIESGRHGEVEAGQHTEINAFLGEAGTFVADDDGNAADVTSVVGVGTINAFQEAEIEFGRHAEIEAFQNTAIAGLVGGASANATDEDGNAAGVTSGVIDGTIDARQWAEVEFGRHGEVEAGQHTEITGLAGEAVASSVDEDGNTAEVGANFIGIPGSLDAFQMAEVEFGRHGEVEAFQRGTIEDAVFGSTWGTAANIYGDTSYTNADVLDLEAVPNGFIDFMNIAEANARRTEADQSVTILGTAGNASAGSTNGKWPYNYAEVGAGFVTLVPNRDGNLTVTQNTQTDEFVPGMPWVTPYNAVADQEATILFDWNNDNPLIPEAAGYTHTEAGNGLFRTVSVDSTIIKANILNGPTRMTTTSSAYGGNWIATVDETGNRQIYYHIPIFLPWNWYNVGFGTTTAHAENWINSDTDLSIDPTIDADAWATAWAISANA